MDEQHLRQLIETNFRLLSLTMREMSTQIEEQGEAYERSREALAEAIEMGRNHQGRLNSMADRLDETVEAIKTLAFGGADERKRIGLLEQKCDGLEARIERLEETG